MKPQHRTPARVKIASAVALIAALILSASPAPGVRAQTSSRAAEDARRAADSFYRHHFARAASARSFRPANIRQLRGRLTPELYRLIMYEFRREAEFSKAHPDEVPYMTGDPFTDTQEYPDTFRVGRAAVSGNRATVPVTFGWRNIPQTETLRIELLKLRGRWLLHNVLSDDGSDLLKTLRRPVYQPGS